MKIVTMKITILLETAGFRQHRAAMWVVHELHTYSTYSENKNLKGIGKIGTGAGVGVRPLTVNKQKTVQ